MNISNNKTVQLQVALVPVCKMVMRFGLHFNEFVRNLQKAYIQAAEEILIKSKITPSLQAIAIKTGMDRRTISEHKNNLNRQYDNPLNKMDMIIIQLLRVSKSNHKRLLNTIQVQTVIDSIYAGHIRSNAVIKELIANKIIVKIDKDKYKIKMSLQQQLTDIKIMADDVDYTAKRLFQTYYKNMFETRAEGKLLQSTCLSTKIAPRFHLKINQLLKNELLKSKDSIHHILKEYESNIPENTYPEIGITQFQFNSNTKEN